MVYELVNFEDVKHITSKEYLSGEAFASDMFDIKYCHTKDGGNKETPAEVFMRVASGLASVESSKELQDRYTQLWFSLLWGGWFRPGGSILTGVGNTRKVSLSNCTTIPLEEDTMESIAKCEYDMMKCAAYRQGLGVDVSRLRPRGAPVSNAAEESTGIVPWATKLNNIGEYVGQKGRMPAVLLSVSVKHPDVEEFIKAKSELGVIENANISIQITNDFMEAVKKDDFWELRFDFKDVRYPSVVKQVRAKELFTLISKTAHASAEPGIQYVDLMAEGTMTQQIYTATGDERFKPRSSNACSEKFLAPYNVCNLASLNMENFSTDEEEYKKELAIVVPLLTRLSDNVISYELEKNLSPLPEQKEIVALTREIGCGITNIHGWLLKQDVAYDSDEAIEKVETFMKYYSYNVFTTSMDLGKEKGNAQVFDLVKDKKVLMGSSYFRNIINEFFGGDATKIVHMRNTAHMSIAPTGSLSNTFPKSCVSSGIEPCFGSAYWRRTRAIDKGVYTYYFVIPNRIQEYVLSKIEKGSDDYSKLYSFSGSVLDSDGLVGKELIAIVNKYLPEGFFKPAHEINPFQKIKLMSKVYKWVDACVSCTYNLPSTATVEDVENIYMAAYDNGVRAVSVYRDGSRQGILIFEDPKTNEAKFSKQPDICNSENRPSSILYTCAPKRPAEIPCDVFFTSIKGEVWTVLVGLLDGNPLEIFVGHASDELYLPKTCKDGIIRKQGKGKYELEVQIRNQTVVYKDLASVLMTDGQRLSTRLISTSLRHGVLPKFIVDQMKKTNGSISDFSTAVARVLSKYVGTYEMEGDASKCPKCGENSLMNVEGCVKCVLECGYSRCS